MIEDRKFFLSQYAQTMTLNAMGIGFSLCAWASWIYLDNAALLGFFALAGTTSSICQLSMLVGTLSQTILPNTHDFKQQRAIVQTAWRVDSVIVSATVLLTLSFFWLTHAEIAKNLGATAFILAGLLTLLEPFVGVAIDLCKSLRYYGWSFFIVNSRIAMTLLGLSILLLHPVSSPRWGIALWACTVFSACGAALLFFYKKGLNPLGQSPPSLTRGFLRNIKSLFVSLAMYRSAALLFGALPSFFIAFIRSPHDIGLYSFALSVTGFLYSALSPVNDQIYSPTFTRLIASNQHSMLLRRILQMMLITLAFCIPASLAIYFLGASVLEWLHKTTFIDSFMILPALLSYRVAIMAFTGFTYSLFSMNRFKALTFFYITAAAASALWYWLFQDSFVRWVWCLPVSALTMGSLSAVYIGWLTWKRKTLLRRSLYTVIPDEQAVAQP